MTTYIGKLLNCGEVNTLIRDEKEKRRKTRLNQVRHYSRENSCRIRSAVKIERKRQLELIRNQLKDDWTRNKEKRLEELSAEYRECLRQVGSGHDAAQIKIAEQDASERKSSSNLEKALSRGNEALARLSLERSQLHEKLVRKNSSIQLVRQVEKDRAKRIASLPSPPSNPNTADVGVDCDEQGTLSFTRTVLSVQDDNVVDARQAARLKEERISKEKAKSRAEGAEKSIVGANRYSEALSHFELQKEYNRIMDELEKIAEWEKSTGRWTADVSPWSKQELVAKQEAIVEELFNRLSIPLVSSFDSPTEEEEETPVHHILVSSSTSEETDRSTAPPVPSEEKDRPIVPPIPKEETDRLIARPVPSDDRVVMSDVSISTLSSSTSTPALNQRQPQSFSIASNETILASHPNDFLSSITIDLSTLPVTEDSSTRQPLSTLRSSFGDSKDQSILLLDEHSGSVEKRPEKDAHHSKRETKDELNVALSSDSSSDRTADSVLAETKPAIKQQELLSPIFRNVAVRRHNLAKDGVHPRETVSNPPSTTDKSGYLRHLLYLAMQQRRGDLGQNGPTTNCTDGGSSTSRMRSPIRVSGIADLKASFIRAQQSLQAELDASRSERKRILSKEESHEHTVCQMPVLSLPRELSTILEVDTPDSPQNLLTSKIEQNFILNERGITDEPDLTFVSSDSSSTSVHSSPIWATSLKLFDNSWLEASHSLRTPCTLSDISWLNSTNYSTEQIAPKLQTFPERPFVTNQQIDKRKDPFLWGSSFPSGMSLSKSDYFMPTPTVSGSSSEFWSSCFSNKSNNKNGSVSPTSLSNVPDYTSSRFPAINYPTQFFDTLQPRSQTLNLASSLDLDSIASSHTQKNSDIDVQAEVCPLCTSSSTNTAGSSAAFNESLSGSLISFLKHELSAESSNADSFSGLETSFEN